LLSTRLTCVFYRLLGDHEPGGYLGVGQALGDQPQCLGLARGESGECSRGLGIWSGALPGELANEPAGDGRGQQRLTSCDDLHRVEEPLRGDVFLSRKPLAPAHSAS
jgi:hypothetical protein